MGETGIACGRGAGALGTAAFVSGCKPLGFGAVSIKPLSPVAAVLLVREASSDLPWRLLGDMVSAAN